MPGTLFVVATPIGNLEDISARAIRVLGQVALIAAEDTRRTAQLLARYGIRTPTTSLHEHNEERKGAQILARLTAGDDVALVSDAGTPTVADPGRRLIRSARDRGYRVEPIPGPSALLAALSASGYCGDTFSFLGFPPIRSKDRKLWFELLRTWTGTVIFFEAPHRIQRTLLDLQEVVGDIPIFVAREITKKHEELVDRPISAFLQHVLAPRGEYTIVADIGHKTNIGPSTHLDERQIRDEFTQLTESRGWTRREAIRQLAKTHNQPQRNVYRAIEQGKKSGK